MSLDFRPAHSFRQVEELMLVLRCRDNVTRRSRRSFASSDGPTADPAPPATPRPSDK